MLRSLVQFVFAGRRERVARRRSTPRRFIPGYESLELRLSPAVIATFSPSVGVLTVFGDTLDNTISVSRNAAGSLLVNGGAVAVKGGSPTVGNVALIQVFGQSGNDTIFLDETQGALPRAYLFGGFGNDVLTGGAGADMLFGGAGDDTFVWNPGDDNDTLEGQDGFDAMIFNGSNVAESINISADGQRVRFFRNVANVTMDLDDVERIDFNAQGGADIVVVNDLTGTDVVEVNLNLVGVTGEGDAQPDAVIVMGTNSDDVILVMGDASGASVLGLAAMVNVVGAEAAHDRLTINALAGDDVLEASALAAGAIQLTGDGGDDDDVLIGGPGLDVLDGGPGDDIEIQG